MATYFLQNDEWSCNGVVGRCFFEFPFALFRPSTEKHVSLIDELKGAHFRDSNDPWMLSFSYMGYDFFVDSHSHGTTTTFIVVQPECPDEILLQVIGIFSAPMQISADYEPTHSELVKSPSPENRKNLLLRWAMRILAIIFLCLAINCFFTGNHENAIAFGVGAIFLAVVSFSTDFASYTTY